jgi:hypothetical protein
MNRRELIRLTVGAAALPLVPLSAFAAVHIVDPIGIHFSQGQFRKWDPEEMRYDYTGPLVQYRLLCYYRSDGLAVAFPSPMSVPLDVAEAEARREMLGTPGRVVHGFFIKVEPFPTPQPDTRCGYNAPWPMSLAEFRLWAQELQASVDGWR